MEPSSWQQKEQSVAPEWFCSLSLAGSSNSLCLQAAFACRRAMKWHNTMRQTAHLFWECMSPQTLRAGRRTRAVHRLPSRLPTQSLTTGEAGGLVSFQVLQPLCRSAQQMALLYEENKCWKSHSKGSFHTGEIKFCGDIKPELPTGMTEATAATRRDGIMALGVSSRD